MMGGILCLKYWSYPRCTQICHPPMRGRCRLRSWEEMSDDPTIVQNLRSLERQMWRFQLVCLRSPTGNRAKRQGRTLSRCCWRSGAHCCRCWGRWSSWGRSSWGRRSSWIFWRRRACCCYYWAIRLVWLIWLRLYRQTMAFSDKNKLWPYFASMTVLLCLNCIIAKAIFITFNEHNI